MARIDFKLMVKTSMTLATSCMAGSRCLFVIFEKRISCRPD